MESGTSRDQKVASLDINRALIEPVERATQRDSSRYENGTRKVGASHDRVCDEKNRVLYGVARTRSDRRGIQEVKESQESLLEPDLSM